jgi:hypothetical protein
MWTRKGEFSRSWLFPAKCCRSATRRRGLIGARLPLDIMVERDHIAKWCWTS